MGYISSRAGTAHAPFCAIRNCVLLRMHGRLFVSIADNGCVSAARQKSIIALAHNPIVTYKQATHVKPFTRTPRRSYLDNFFKVIVPGRSNHSSHYIFG